MRRNYSFFDYCGETKENKLIFTPNLKDLPEQEIIIWKRHGLK